MQYTEASIITNELIRRGINLAESYDAWTRLAFSLSTLGESGRSLFHAISSLSGKYKKHENDRQFSVALRSNRKTGIGTFFWMAEQAGIDVKQILKENRTADRPICNPPKPMLTHARQPDYIPHIYM